MIQSLPATDAPYAAFARIYDAVTGDAVLAQIWRSFIASCRHYGVRFSSAADLGCGTGLFLKRLTDAGLRLYGIDRSAPMLAIARRRLHGRDVELSQQDLAAFTLPEPVELATCNGATLNYATDLGVLRKIFRRVYRNTAPETHFIFDVILSLRELPGVPHDLQVIRLPGAKAHWTIDMDPAGRGSVVDMRMALRHRNGSWRVYHEQHRQRWFLLVDIRRLLRSAHWRMLGVHAVGNSSLEPANEGWVQVVARRS